MKRSYNPILFFVLLCLSGCSPSGSDLQIMLAETIAAMPSFTPYPTYTLYPTQTQFNKIAPATSTPTPSSTLTPSNPPTSLQQLTATAVQATKEYVAEFMPISWNEINNYSDNHSGEKIKIKGRLFQVIKSIDMLLWYPGTFDAFYVAFNNGYSGVHEDQIITIYGTVQGMYCYSTQSGGSNCVPKINGEWFE